MALKLKILLLPAALAAAPALFAENAGPITIKWKAVRNSYGYVVQYRHEGGTVVSKKTAANRVELRRGALVVRDEELVRAPAVPADLPASLVSLMAERIESCFSERWAQEDALCPVSIRALGIGRRHRRRR